MYSNINKFCFISVLLVCLLITPFSLFAESRKFKFVYITDLNLYPTPIKTQYVKHSVEKDKGLLIYETQVILQELIKTINQKISPDFVVFGGNNIINLKAINNDVNSLEPSDLWHLFLDMISEIKSDYYIVFGENESSNISKDELLKSCGQMGLRSNKTYWSKKFDEFNFFVISLDNEIFSKSSYALEEYKWFKSEIIKNKNLDTVVFINKPIISENGVVNASPMSKSLFDLLLKHSQLKLLISGNYHLNRIRSSSGPLFVISSSPSAFPCTYKLFEVSGSMIKIQSVKIPLKGIVKKSQTYILDSKLVTDTSLGSSKAVLNYLSGKKTDNDLSVDF